MKMTYKNPVILLTLLLTMGFYACQQNTDPDAGETAQASMGGSNEAAIPSVEAERPKKRNFEGNLEITGTLEANQMVSLRAMEGGFLTSISKDIGDYVSAGTVLATLENPELRQGLKLAEADLASYQGDLKQAAAKVKIAEAQLDYKRSYYNRIKGIYEKTPDLITIDELENAKAEMLVAEAEVDVAKAQPEVVQAHLKSAEAKVAAAQVRVGNLSVTAPFSGHITHRYVDKGAFIQSAVSNASAMSIFDIVDMNKLRLVVEYPESDIGNIGVGSVVNIAFPELNGKVVTSKITRMAAAMNPKSKTVRAEIDIPKPDKALKAGMYANVKTEQKSSRSNLSINKLAITAVKNKPYVFKVVNDKIEKIPVKLGMENKTHIEVLSDNVSENDVIVIKGKGLINVGMPVRAKIVN